MVEMVLVAVALRHVVSEAKGTDMVVGRRHKFLWCQAVQ